MPVETAGHTASVPARQRMGRTTYGMRPGSLVEKLRTRTSGPLALVASTIWPSPA